MEEVEAVVDRMWTTSAAVVEEEEAVVTEHSKVEEVGEVDDKM